MSNPTPAPISEQIDAKLREALELAGELHWSRDQAIHLEEILGKARAEIAGRFSHVQNGR